MANKPPPRTHTVPQQDVLNAQAILGQDLVLEDIIVQIPDPLATLQWLARHWLIANSTLCRVCDRPATLITRVDSTDGFRWRCRPHHFTKSVREGPFFKQSPALEAKVHESCTFSVTMRLSQLSSKRHVWVQVLCTLSSTDAAL